MVNALFLWTAALCFKQTEKSASRQVILQYFSYFWSLSISSASRSVWLLMVDARVLCWVIRWGVWGWVSLRWSPFTGDGPDKVMWQFFFKLYIGETCLWQRKQTHTTTSFLTLATAKMVAIRSSFLELLNLLSNGYISRCLFQLFPVAHWEVEGFGHCGTSRSFSLKRITLHSSRD